LDPLIYHDRCPIIISQTLLAEVADRRGRSDTRCGGVGRSGLRGVSGLNVHRRNHEALIEPDEDGFADHGLTKAIEQS
jgi:hypothetical protein